MITDFRIVDCKRYGDYTFIRTNKGIIELKGAFDPDVILERAYKNLEYQFGHLHFDKLKIPFEGTAEFITGVSDLYALIIYRVVLGAILLRVELDDDVLSIFTDKISFKLHHIQDCCESVELVEGFNELQQLVGDTIVAFYETTNSGIKQNGSQTWTFYTIVTKKGSATLRWYGSSNGYYSESVNMAII